MKIKKLDNELGTYKAQMAKLRDGPGKVGASVGILCFVGQDSESLPWLRLALSTMTLSSDLVEHGVVEWPCRA